jgi:hypothetical protein
MTVDELEHAIRASCDITGDDEVYVFGSQSILGQIPDPPSQLAMSAEADVSPRHMTDKTELLNSIGEGSHFHQTHGFYVHGVPIKEAATLPKNWELRTVPFRVRGRHATGLCLEVHDLAASKLVAFRDKDRDFVRVLLVAKLIKPRTLIGRIRRLPIEGSQQQRLIAWVDAIVNE